MRGRVLTTFFKDIGKDDLELVGGKGANLGEMTNAGFPVPPGFVVTVEAYQTFLKDNSLEAKIYPLLKKLDVNRAADLEFTAKNIQKMLLSSPVPQGVSNSIFAAYKKLSGAFNKELVAVRSSATAEDLPGASFAGQQATFFNIKGEANVVKAVRDCWASLFTARSIFYRVQNKINHEKVFIAVVVQKMIQSEASGVMFSIDPLTNEKDRIVIESIWGIGELIVQGSVIPDRYVVQKETFDVLSKEVSHQDIMLSKKGVETKEIKVTSKLQDKQKIEDKEIVLLAKYADKLQKHYYFPQDIEWAKEKGKLYITQTRPVTTIEGVDKIRKETSGNSEVKVSTLPILKGIPAAPGVGSGSVKLLKSPKEISKVIQGDILVAPMTSPDYVPAMKKAAAIVTDAGGQTSHAAIVSRELGIPCVVGTKEATKKLTDGMIVSVDGSTGEVFLGARVISKLSKKEPEKIIKTKTATRLYVNMAEVERAEEVGKMNVEGIGLLRAEFMMANIGIHPREAIKRKEQEKYVEKLAYDLETFCKSFDPRPVVYRTSDFKTNEFRNLIGGKSWEPEEENPMLGYRGAFRYVANPEVFNLELKAIKKVREKYKNLYIMVPFVRSPEELAKVRKLVVASGLFEEPSFKFWMMCELPVNVVAIEDFIKVGIDGVSIGSNDLTMLIHGTDRDNGELSGADDVRSPSMLWCFERVIKACNKHGITSSICGQAPSIYDDLTEKLVSFGITSISVNADALNRARGIIIEAEKKFVKNR